MKPPILVDILMTIYVEIAVRLDFAELIDEIALLCVRAFPYGGSLALPSVVSNKSN